MCLFSEPYKSGGSKEYSTPLWKSTTSSSKIAAVPELSNSSSFKHKLMGDITPFHTIITDSPLEINLNLHEENNINTESLKSKASGNCKTCSKIMESKKYVKWMFLSCCQKKGELQFYNRLPRIGLQVIKLEDYLFTQKTYKMMHKCMYTQFSLTHAFQEVPGPE